MSIAAQWVLLFIIFIHCGYWQTHALFRWQHFSARNDVIASVLKVRVSVVVSVFATLLALILSDNKNKRVSNIVQIFLTLPILTLPYLRGGCRALQR